MGKSFLFCLSQYLNALQKQETSLGAQGEKRFSGSVWEKRGKNVCTYTGGCRGNDQTRTIIVKPLFLVEKLVFKKQWYVSSQNKCNKVRTTLKRLELKACGIISPDHGVCILTFLNTIRV